jgi:hypothetical protein
MVFMVGFTLVECFGPLACEPRSTTQPDARAKKRDERLDPYHVYANDAGVLIDSVIIATAFTLLIMGSVSLYLSSDIFLVHTVLCSCVYCTVDTIVIAILAVMGSWPGVAAPVMAIVVVFLVLLLLLLLLIVVILVSIVVKGW